MAWLGGTRERILFVALALCAPAVLATPAARLAAQAAPADAPSAAELQLLGDVVAALRQADGPALADHVDFERRDEERIQRGTGLARWADLDETAQVLEKRDVAHTWIASHPSFNREITLVNARRVADPDAGLGPVPDRRIVQAIVRNALVGQQRDLLLVITPDLKLLDLVLGEPYYPGDSPSAGSGLLPKPELSIEEIPVVHWPDGADDAERADVNILVQALLESVPGPERELTLEGLHRNPRPSVAALAEHLRAMEKQPEPDATAEALLDAALHRITGRASGFAPLRPTGVAPAAWRTGNHAAVAAWVRWLNQNGDTFAATTIEHPLDPTLRERHGTKGALELSGWDAALAKQEETATAAANAPPPDAASGNPGASPDAGPPGGVPAPPGPPPNSGTAPADASPATAAPSTPAAPAPPSEPAPPPVVLTGGDQPAAASRQVLFPAAADFKVLHGGKEVTGRSLEAQLTPSQREALNAWAEPAKSLGLRIVVSDTAEQIVVGHAPDKLLQQASGWMDDAYRLLDPALPFTGGREARTTVAFIFDEEGSRSPGWSGVIKLLVARNQLFASDGDRLLRGPVGFTRRGAPLFLQPTWDITGEGEFKLENEIVHKFAQCLLTERAGEQPPNILWGIGDVAEQKLFGTVYQFNATGFVNTADHFDWPVTTRQYLERHKNKKGWSLGALAATDSAAGQPAEAQMVTWAALAYLTAAHPDTLRSLLTDLAALHAAADPRGNEAAYRGDPAQTRAALDTRLGALNPDTISDWLKNRN